MHQNIGHLKLQINKISDKAQGILCTHSWQWTWLVELLKRSI